MAYDSENYTEEQRDRQRWLDEMGDQHNGLVSQIEKAKLHIKELEARLADNDARMGRIHEEPHMSGVKPTGGKVVPGKSSRKLQDGS